jgi:hypothetical protein
VKDKKSQFCWNALLGDLAPIVSATMRCGDKEGIAQ